MNYYFKAFKNFSFKGRISRKDFWMFYLICILIYIGIITFETICGLYIETIYNTIYPFSLVYGLIMLLPSLSMQTKRLHDIDKSGNWLILSFFPIIGTIILFYFMSKKGDAEENRYGMPPCYTEPKSKKSSKAQAEPILISSESLSTYSSQSEHKSDYLYDNEIFEEPGQKHKKKVSYILVFLVISLVINVIQVYMYININSELNETEEHYKEIVSNTKEYYEKIVSDTKEHYEEVVSKLEYQLFDLDFYNEHAVLVDDYDGYYHKLSCDDVDLSSFYIYNIELAEYLGYKPCPNCH